MINGTEDLDAAVAAIARVVDIVREEKQSIDYTHVNAPMTGKLLSDKMSISELVEFADTLRKSTSESKENVDKVYAVLREVFEILEHYNKLAEIGEVWASTVDKTTDDLRYYQ
jgi:multidrug resistance efflux pump